MVRSVRRFLSLPEEEGDRKTTEVAQCPTSCPKPHPLLSAVPSATGLPVPTWVVLPGVSAHPSTKAVTSLCCSHLLTQMTSLHPSFWNVLHSFLSILEHKA